MPQNFREGAELIRTLPNFALFLLVSGTLVGAVALAPFLAQRVFGLPANDKRSQGALDAFKAITSFAALMIGFSLLQAQNNLRSVEEMVSREAAAFTAMDRLLLRFGTPEMTALRGELSAYGRSVVQTEWPLLATQNRSTEADARFSVLSTKGQAVDPGTHRQDAIYAEFLKVLTELSDFREMRIANAGIGLPSLVWAAVCAMCCLLILLSGLMTPSPDRLVQVMGLMAAISLLVSLTITVDGPFSGDISVSPQAISRALARNEARN